MKRSIAAMTLYVAAVSAMAMSFRGCCSPKGQIQLLATVVDDPTSQIIPSVTFTGAAKYAQCNRYYGDNGAGGGGQSNGPCARWIVYSVDEGGQILVSADGYETQSYDVAPADEEACGTPDRPTHTFRMVRKPSP